MSTTPAGWYEDSQDPDRLRYWDGDRWTDHYSERLPHRERTAEPITFDPEYRPQHAQFPRNGVPTWVWLGPVIAIAAAGATLLVLWLTGSLVWAPPVRVAG